MTKHSPAEAVTVHQKLILVLVKQLVYQLTNWNRLTRIFRHLVVVRPEGLLVVGIVLQIAMLCLFTNWDIFPYWRSLFYFLKLLRKKELWYFIKANYFLFSFAIIIIISCTSYIYIYKSNSHKVMISIIAELHHAIMITMKVV